MPSQSSKITLLLLGCFALIVCCVILVGRPLPDDADVQNFAVPGSTAAGEAMPGSTTIGHISQKDAPA